MRTISELKEAIRTNLNVIFYEDMLTALNELEEYRQKQCSIQVKCEILRCKHIDECGSCSKKEILIEETKHIYSGVCYHFEKR